MNQEKPFSQERLLQAARMTVAGVLSIYIAGLFKFPQGYWAAISAFVVIGSDVRTTVKASGDRLLGTAIGAILGAVFAYLAGNQLLWFGLAVALTVLLCQALGLGQSYRLACVTVAILMLVRGSTSPELAAVYRFLEVALGIIVALAISAIPPRRSAQIS